MPAPREPVRRPLGVPALFKMHTADDDVVSLRSFAVALCLVASVFFAAPRVASGHPGGTASDGCHHCRTNCDRWGEAWDRRHCHNGSEPVRTSSDADGAGDPWFLGGLAVIGGVLWLINRSN